MKKKHQGRIRVTFCAYDFKNYVSGPNAWLLRLLPQLRKKGIDVDVLFFTPDPDNTPTIDALNLQGINTSIFGFKENTHKKIDWILQKISDRPPDVFVPNLVVSAYFAAGWIREAGIPTVGILHSDDSFYHAILKNFTREGDFFCLSALVCVSKHLKEITDQRAPENVCVYKIPYGVPIPDRVAQPPGDVLRLIYVGRLEEEQKQISELTMALCRATKEVPKVEARIYGDGSAVHSIENILRDSAVGEKVTLVGRVSSSEIQSHMLESHVLVLLSDYEGLPIALMEAMACGLVPICKYMSSGIPELIQHGQNGLIVHDRSTELIDAVKQLKQSSQKWSRLSKNARETIIRAYNSQDCADRWKDTLFDLASRNSAKKHLQFPHKRSLPRLRYEFFREDFRKPEIVFRIARKILQIRKARKPSTNSTNNNRK